LSGVRLGHRLSRDVDLFFDEKVVLRELLPQLGELASSKGGSFRSVRDAAHSYLPFIARRPERPGCN
jgi:hypothetical protein